MKPSAPQTTYSKAMTAKANYAQQAGGAKAGPSAAASPEQLAARLKALEDQVASLLQRIYDDGAGNIHIATNGNISLHGKEILIEGNNKASLRVGLGSVVDLNAAGDATITANGKASLVAAAQVVFTGATIKMNTGFAETTGLFKANTVQAVNVIGANYTPGAGNIW